MNYLGSTFGGLHALGSIGNSNSFGLIQASSISSSFYVGMSLTHELGHGLSMYHDTAGKIIKKIMLFLRFANLVIFDLQSIISLDLSKSVVNESLNNTSLITQNNYDDCEYYFSHISFITVLMTFILNKLSRASIPLNVYVFAIFSCDKWLILTYYKYSNCIFFNSCSIYFILQTASVLTDR